MYRDRPGRCLRRAEAGALGAGEMHVLRGNALLPILHPAPSLSLVRGGGRRASGALSRLLSSREGVMQNCSARRLKRNRTGAPKIGLSRALQPKFPVP